MAATKRERLIAQRWMKRGLPVDVIARVMGRSEAEVRDMLRFPSGDVPARPKVDCTVEFIQPAFPGAGDGGGVSDGGAAHGRRHGGRGHR